jgi:hypothetical protein
MILLICPSGKNHPTLVIPGREAKRREPGIHNHRCLLSGHSGPNSRNVADRGYGFRARRLRVAPE